MLRSKDDRLTVSPTIAKKTEGTTEGRKKKESKEEQKIECQKANPTCEVIPEWWSRGVEGA